MTRIDFYSNAESRLQTVCQLIAKAHARRIPVALFSPDPDLASTTDRLLWTFQAISFVPHCLSRQPIAGETPILIVPSAEESPHDELLVNLSPECPPGFARFKRLIEVVGREDTERQSARLRWRHYKERGYEIRHVDLEKLS